MASNNVASKIADISPDEETWKKNIVEHAKLIHGKDVVQEIGDKSNDEFDFITQIKDLVNGPVKQPETLESKYLEPYVYPTLRTAEKVGSTIALPFQYAAAPIGQAANAASNLIQGKELEESPNPITHPIDYARKFGTTSALTRTLPIGNQPIAEMLPETEAGNYLRKEFPKASDMARFISPNDIAAGAADMAIAHSVPTPNVNIKAPISLETAADYVRSLAKNNKQLLELEASGKVYDLAKMVQQDPDSYLHPFKPNKIYENIEGKISPETASRDRSSGLLNQAVEKQNKFVEDLPRGEYSIPREEMQREALDQLNKGGQLEAGQRSSAENIIKANIPIEQPDPAKIAKIRAAKDAQDQLSKVGREIPGERLALESQIQAQKNAMINAINEQPNLIKNPKFREDLQWLSDLEVADPSQSNVFSQQSRVVGNKDTTGLMNTEREIPLRRPDDLAAPLGNQKILDIAQGAQKEPSMIPNPAKSEALGKAMEDLRGLNDELRELSNRPASKVKNKQLLAKIAEKNKLEGFVRDNFDPTAPDVESYLDIMRKRNEEPAGYASTLRRLGNKLQEPLAPGEVSTDIGSKNLAGRAIEKAGRGAQEQIMSSNKVPWQNVAKYEDLNKQISNMIHMRDLMQGNLVADGAAAVEFMPSGVSGKSGIVGYAAKAKDRFLKPIGGSMVTNAQNSAQVVKSMQPQAAMAQGLIGNTMKAPLPMQLVSFQIPRDSRQILQNKDIVIAKIAQMSNDPNMTNMFKDAIEQHPEKLPKVLPALVMQFPDLFEPDDYNRIDGKILDPQLKAKALKDIQNSRTMDIRQKAFKAKQLTEEGIYEN